MREERDEAWNELTVYRAVVNGTLQMNKVMRWTRMLLSKTNLL